MRSRTFVALFAVVWLAWPAAAQEQRGSIEGLVKDTSGAVLPGVTVTLQSNTGVKLDAITDGSGLYRFPSLLPGIYTVTANLQGFGPGKVSNVVVALGQVKKVDFALALAGVTETVQVTAESPLVDVKQSARATNIRAEQVELLPHDRNFTSLVTQAPGVNFESKSGSTGIMIDGAAAAENRYVIDGMETTDLIHGQSGKNMLADFVEEVQIKSSGYPAEYGGSTGGVINVITKSGSNEFHGSALTYWQGSSVQGAPTPTLRLGLSNNTIAEYQEYAKDEENRYEPGGSIGGPLFRNRMWFFGAYQPAYTKTVRTVSRGTAGDVGTSGNPNATPSSTTRKEQVEYLTANQTMQLGSKLRTRVAFNNSWSKRDGQLAALNGTDSPTTVYTKGTKFPNWSLSGTADYVVGPKFFLGFRAGRFLSDTHDFNVQDVPRFLFLTSNIGQPGVPAEFQHSVNFANVPSNTGVIRDETFRNYLQADATYYGSFGGEHQIKGGVQIDRRGNDVLSGELQNRISLTWTSTGQGCPTGFGAFGCYSVRSNGVAPRQGFVTQGNVKSNVYGIFLQDTWTLNNRLTINAGIRTESENVPAYTTAEGVASSPIKFGMGDKIAPRAGFSYDLKGDGRTKAYGSWGVFYDIFKLQLPRGSFGGDKWLEYFYTLDTPNYTTLRDSPDCPPACPGTLVDGPIDFRAVSVTPGLDVETNLKPMRSQEMTFGVEHQLNNVSAVTARFIHKQLDRGIDDVGDLDPETGSEFYIIANPGEGLVERFDISSGASLFPPQGATNLSQVTPKAIRDYNALELSYTKRLANNWSFYTSYTLSRDSGNYPGLSQSDENGRSDPNVGRTFDYPAMSFDGSGNPIDGPLPTDRTHQWKAQAIYQLPWGTSIGANQFVASGIPISSSVAIIANHNYPIYWKGRGDAGRTPMFSQTDLFVQHSFRLGATKSVQLQATVLNLFNEANVTDRFNSIRRSGAIPLSSTFYNEAAFYNHQLDFDALINSAFAAGVMTRDPRYLRDSAYQSPLQARFGVRFVF